MPPVRHWQCDGRLVGLSLVFSKKLENLEAACAMFLAYYNFCWRTRYPDWSGRPGKRRPPAAVLEGSDAEPLDVRHPPLSRYVVSVAGSLFSR
jgi:hypothetical protein